jgi:hypothetical protein
MKKLVFAMLFVAACDVGEVDVVQTVTDDLARGQDPCSDPVLKKKANVKEVPGDPHRFVGIYVDDMFFVK